MNSVTKIVVTLAQVTGTMTPEIARVNLLDFAHIFLNHCFEIRVIEFCLFGHRHAMILFDEKEIAK